MPRIPVAQRAGAIEHVRAEAPITGGGQTLKYYGGDGTAEAFARAGQKIGRAMEGFGNAIMQFAAKSQDVENKLAAAEDRALYTERSNALLKQITANPGASEEDQNKWFKEFEENYARDRKQYTDKRSEAHV